MGRNRKHVCSSSSIKKTKKLEQPPQKKGGKGGWGFVHLGLIHIGVLSILFVNSNNQERTPVLEFYVLT